MSLHEKARTTIEIDGQNASQVLDQLREKADQFRRAMTEANKQNDLVSFRKAERELKSTERSMRQLERATFDTNRVLRNLSTTSFTDLTRTQRQLQNELKRTTRGTQQYITTSRQLQLVTNELRKVRTEMTGVAVTQQGMLRKLATGFNRYSMMVLSAVGALTTLGLTMRKLSMDAMELESKVAELSAITGLAGENLQWLEDQAKKLSVSTTQDGVRITKSAIEILEAYKLMGSAKPELLANKEALAAVTTEALKLAEAASMDTATAVKSLAQVMNQFGADASQATRYINALAAGSKVGAAEVDDIAKAITRFGAIAGTANISLEESVGLVETLAEKGIKGEQAGTILRNALLRMMTAADHLNPRVVGLQRAFENLAKENYGAQEMLQLFGQRSVVAGTILVQNTDRLKYFSDAVTDTNVAIEQANINTATQLAKLEQARNGLKLAAMELGQRLAPALSKVTWTSGKLVRLLIEIVPLIEKYGKYIVIATSALVAYRLVIWATVTALKLKDFWTKKVTFSVTALNAALKKNKFALAAAAIATAVTSLRAFKKEAKETTDQVKELNPVLEESIRIFENYSSIQDRLRVVETLDLRQLQNLERSITSQIASQEDLTAALKSELQKRIDADTEIQRQKELIRSTDNREIQANFQRNINMRIRYHREELNELYKHNIETYSQLEAHLEKVKAAITAHPESALKIQDEFFELEINALEKHLKQKELALYDAFNQEKITKEQLENELYALELSGLITRLQLHRDFGKQTIDLEIEIARKIASVTKDIQDQKNDETLKTELEFLEKLFKERRLRLLQEHNDGFLSAQQLQEKLRDLELQALNERKGLYQLFGQDTIDIDLAIAEHKRKTLADETEAVKAALDIENRLRQEALHKRKQEAEEFKSIMDNLGGDLGDLMGRMATDTELTSQEVAKNLTLIFLDTVHNIVRMSIAKIWAQSLASAESIATFGVAGVVKATALSAMVEVAFAAVKSAVKSSMDKNRVQQRFSGRYYVTGAEDGKEYSAKYIGSPKTGLVWNPSLISEQGPEIIVDAKRSRNIRMRYPQLLEAIKAVPQHASGTLPAKTSPSDASSLADDQMKRLITQNTAVLSFLNDQLRKGIDSRVSYTHMKEQFAKAENIENAASRS